MAKSADKAAKAEAKELARLEKRLDKARAVETKRAQKAEKAADRVSKLTDRVAARRDGSPAATAARSDAADVPVTDSVAEAPASEVADGAPPAGTAEESDRHDANEAQG